MLTGTKLFTVRQIPIQAHWSAWLIATLVALNIGSETNPFIGAVAAVGFLASILFHELGHAFTASHYGVPTQRIALWGLGGIAQLGGEARTARAEGWIAAAGPLSSLALAGVGMGSAYALEVWGITGTGPAVLFWLGLVNALLAAFNLLPGAPLDGGRILAAWRWGRHGDRYRARDEAGVAGQVVGSIVTGVGVWLVLRGWGTLIFPLTGLFIALNAAAERKAVQAARRLDGLRVADLTWFGVAEAPADTDAETMLWQRARLGGAGVVAVTDPQGHLSGVVPEERLLKVPEQLRPFTRLAQLMVPVTNLAQAQPDEPLTSAITRLNPMAPVVTVWQDGRLVGVVPTERLRQRLSAPS